MSAPRDERPAASAAAAATTAPRPRPRTARRERLDGVIAGVLGAGVTPDPLLAGSIAARATWPRLAIELALVAGRDTTREAEATAAFTRVIARPAACWLPIRRRVELGACGDLEAGVVRASGDRIVNGRGLTRLWLAAGSHGTLRWPASPARGFGQLQLGLALPITRDRYRFMPDIVVHETPPVTGWLGLGVGLRFQ